jgi:hypothetical protein
VVETPMLLSQLRASPLAGRPGHQQQQARPAPRRNTVVLATSSNGGPEPGPSDVPAVPKQRRRRRQQQKEEKEFRIDDLNPVTSEGRCCGPGRACPRAIGR